jgi:hypothetical protein
MHKVGARPDSLKVLMWWSSSRLVNCGNSYRRPVFEQRVRVVHGNGIATSYRYYEKSRRLQEINADHRDRYLVERGQSARAFQRMRYEYDVAGNLERVRNEIP